MNHIKLDYATVVNKHIQITKLQRIKATNAKILHSESPLWISQSLEQLPLTCLLNDPSNQNEPRKQSCMERLVDTNEHSKSNLVGCGRVWPCTKPDAFSLWAHSLMKFSSLLSSIAIEF